MRNIDPEQSTIEPKEGFHYTRRYVAVDCYWNETDVAWETSCGNLFNFTADGPEENKFKYCPYCGGRLAIPVVVTDEE